MDDPLVKLFERFKVLSSQLQQDLDRIAERMPANRRSVFKLAEWNLETFRRNWQIIAHDDKLRSDWIKRLSGGGDQGEDASSIKAALARVSNAATNQANDAA